MMVSLVALPARLMHGHIGGDAAPVHEAFCKVRCQFPNAGPPAADMEPEHRELLIPFGVAGYVLLYRFDADSAAVTVLAVRHQKEAGY